MKQTRVLEQYDIEKSVAISMVTDPSLNDYTIRIHDLPNHERPHEKLFAHGPEHLSNQELLAAVLYTGTKREDVLHMTSRILHEYGDNYIVHETDPAKVAQYLDIPKIKAIQIVACFALGKRLFEKEKRHKPIYIRNAKDAFNYVRDMGTLEKEHLRGLYLNSRHKLIHEETISIGTVSGSIVHPREVFRPAIEHGAAAIILAHNHPSNDPDPSKADVEITKKIAIAGTLLGIELLDHLIIIENTYTNVPITH